MQEHWIPIPTPFPVGDVNAYLILADPLTLVDCGPSTEEAWIALAAGVAAAGCRVEDIQRLLLTHPHPDHAGLAGRVQEVSGCRVLAHPVDHARLRGDPAEWQRIVAFLVETARRSGAPVAVVDGLEGDLQSIPRYVVPLKSVEPIEDGDRVGLASGSLEVLFTPGHARGALCFWDADSGTLYPGDTLLPHISSNAILEPGQDTFRTRSLLAYRRTLERLVALEAARVLPGHGEPMGSPAVLIEQRFRFYDRRAARIRSLVEEGLRTPWEIALQLFPEAGERYAHLVVSEVVGHLDLLAERGEIRFDGQHGPWRAEPVQRPFRVDPS